jgi:NhaP-type Na+/H+ or K+/H+ antiporter
VADIIFPIVSFLVLISIFVHGVTVPLFHLSVRQIMRSAQRQSSISELQLETVTSDVDLVGSVAENEALSS